MTYEELFDAYRQVVTQRDQLAAAGDDLWNAVLSGEEGVAVKNWQELRGIGSEPPSEEWAEWR